MATLSLQHAEHVPTPAPIPVGVIKTIGEFGPMYEVLGPGAPGPKGRTVHIRIFFTDEELDYPFSEMLEDPLKP